MKIDKDLYKKFFEHISEFYADNSRFDDFPHDDNDVISYETKSIIKAMDKLSYHLDINLFEETEEEFKKDKELYT